MKPYTPSDWYWTVGGDATKAYSSLVGDYVQATAPAFVTWKSDGSIPTAIATEAALGDVLSQYYPDATRPVPPVILDGYQQSQADDVFKTKLSKLLFVMINDIRVLKGQVPLTVQQARAFVKGIM